MKKDKKPEYVSKSGLKCRGWTETLIKKYLGESDKEVDNPHYRCAAPMQMYDMERVKIVEATDEFAIAKEKAAKRSAIMKVAAEKAQKTRHDKTIAWAEEVEVEALSLDYDTAVDCAIDSYNDFHFGRRDDFSNLATRKSDKSFLARITENYLRHHCSNYELLLNWLHGNVGADEAYYIIRQKADEKVWEANPWLAEFAS